MSKLATILGVLIGTIMLLVSMVDPKNLTFIDAFFNWQGLAVVLGGTFAAVLVNYPLNQVGCVFSGFFRVFSAEVKSTDELIQQLVELSHVAKSQGVLKLEHFVEDIKDEFMRNAINDLLIYGRKDELKLSLEQRIVSMRYRQYQCHEVYMNMASYAPAFGMMGTVMGLIIMMTSQGAAPIDPFDMNASQDVLSSLLSGMGLALVTTFYGVVFANFVFMPIAGKLKVLSDEETMRCEMIMQGIISINEQVSPLVVKEKLLTFVTEKQRERLQDLR